MRRKRGQALPFLLLFLPFLLFFIGVAGEEILLSIEKVRNQRTTDMLAMQVSTDQARALNAIAAINSGLDKIHRNVSIYSGILTGLGACAATVWGASICARPFLTLSGLTPQFFQRVKRLGEILGAWQDALVVWGEKTPTRSIHLFNLLHAKDTFVRIYPDVPKLKIHRAKAGEIENHKKCKKERKVYNQNDKNISVPLLGKDDYADLYYKSLNGGELVRKNQRGLIQKEIQIRGTPYRLEMADLYRCRTLFGILKKLKIFSPANLMLPGKYILNDDFEKNRITVALLHHTASSVLGGINFSHLKEEEAFAPLLSKGVVKALRALPHSTLSESTVIGDSETEMNFFPGLAQVTEGKKLSKFLGVNGIEIDEKIAH